MRPSIPASVSTSALGVDPPQYPRRDPLLEPVRDDVNTTERIVEAYFRHVMGCFTATDVKVEGGNNRQLDMVAVNLRSGAAYHAEVTVKISGFDPTIEKLRRAFDHKFFGVPRENEKPTGDHAKGKSYLDAIKRTYRRLGLTPSTVQRVFVCWDVKGATGSDIDLFLRDYSKARRLGGRPIEIWSFRERVLPELAAAVGTSNYEDDALRTLSLLEAAKRQRARGR